MYLPLPGFIYTGYRKYFGNIQDLAHPEYKRFRETLIDLFKDYPNVIYAAGHEHNLQYFEKDSLHHIISGGGGEGTYIARKKGKTDFAYQSLGFSKLSFYSNGNVWMEFISPDSTQKGKVVYTRKLFNKPVFEPELEEANKDVFDFSDSNVIVSLTEIYNRGSFYTFLRGENYRNIWQTKVEFPVFDMGIEKGGLSIIKRGGGQQSRSLRLEDKNGRQYVLRSVNKYVEKALPGKLQGTVAVDILQYAISASHPYAAITVPRLADAAGIMHTNPKFVWLPDDPRLGIYGASFANDVYLFEERPAGNRNDIKSFSWSEKIVSTQDVVNEIQNKPDHVVDQDAVVRARIFDILINDWDRHDDQWRWASFKEDGRTIYRPIPRDRDQVYFVNEGAAMWLVTHFYPLRKFHGFEKEIYDVKGLNYNARHFDRYFMTEPDRDDWLSITKDIQKNLTDTIIHQAIHALPPNIYDSGGTGIETKLKARRDSLSKSIMDYYRFLSKTVDVVGTNEQELFLVQRLKNGNTRVTIHELSEKNRKIKDRLYFREFKFNETKEIRLYGLKGEDTFKLYGSGKKGIKVRIIAGKGDDSIIDYSKVRGSGRKTIVYDRKDKENVIVKSNETHLQLSKKKSINVYDRLQYKRNTVVPVVIAGYNVDDGIYIGGGVKLKRYNFRDSIEHKIKANIAFETGAFTVRYNGLFSALSKTFDLAVDAEVSIPKNVDNFYGLGNNSKKLTDDKSYYRVRYQYIWLNPMLKHMLSKHLNYSFGAFYQFYKVTDTIDRFIGDAYPQYLDSTAYISHSYAGINTKLKFDTRNSEILPTRGILWETQTLGFYSIKENGNNFLKVLSDLSLYVSYNKDPRVVFALRFGGAINIGNYEFYHANFLGGKSNLRGFRNNRFAGDRSFHINTEIRYKLFDIRSYLFNGQTGVLFFNDIGRVWVSGVDSKKWHDGFGAGIWVTPFDFTVLTLTYNRSYEENLIDFTLRFLF
ncbi:MAG: BamA/TamA family outer membrane protein [Saprospiraceae bacterium]|nr:BamA/TamA family outer membrane protein [Saprospiraceae bacterium]